MRLPLATLAISLVALAIASFVLIRDGRLVVRFCDDVERLCVEGCDRSHADAISRLRLEEDLAQLDHRQRLIDCVAQTDPQQCRQDEQNRFAQATAGFEERKGAADRERDGCRIRCARQGAECRGEPLVEADENPPRVVIECIDAPGTPCFKEVAEICTKIEGVCPQCELTLCGDPSWSFEADSPVTVALVAGSRTLATSSGSGNRATLSIPKDIKLQPAEKLGLRLDTKSKKVTLERK